MNESELATLGIPSTGYDVWQNKNVSISGGDLFTIGSHDVFLLKA